MRKLINILKEVLNDSQKKALARASVDRVNQIIDHYTGNSNSKQIMVRGSDDKAYAEIHLGNVDVVMHPDKSNTNAKFVPSTTKDKLSFIMIYNASINIKNGLLIIDYDVKALYDELIKFLDFRGNIKEDAEKDINQGRLSDEYVDYIDKQINSYTSNNNVVRKIEDGYFDAVEINFPKLKIILSANKSPLKHDASFEKAKGKNGQAIITVNRADIKTDPKLKVDYDETSLKHELKHYYDSLDNTSDFEKNLKIQYKNNDKTGKGTVKDPDAYWNNPNEVNAYFFEHFMPDVLKFLKKEKEVPGTIEEFKKDIFNNRGAKSFYDKLNKENKSKIDKRLETYYKDILTNPSFNIENNNQIDNSKLEKSTYGWIKKLKDKIGLFEEE